MLNAGIMSRNCVVGVLCIAVVGAGALQGFGEETLPVTAGPVVEGFQLSVSAKKDVVEVGDAINLNVIVKNTGQQPRQLPAQDAPHGGFYVTATDAQGKSRPTTRYGKWMYRQSVAGWNKITLAGGSQVRWGADADRMVDLADPGVYTVTVGYYVPKLEGDGVAKVLSNPVTVKVTEPRLASPFVLRSRREPDRDNPLSGLTATVLVAKVQSTRNGGIYLLLDVANKGRKAVEIRNPLDFISLLVTDKEGYPLALPPTASRLLIHTRDIAEQKKLRLSFKLHEVFLNRRRLKMEEIEASAFRLPPGAHLKSHLEIDRLWDKPQEPLPGDPQPEVKSVSVDADGKPKLIKIPAGNYQVSVRVMLVASGTPTRQSVSLSTNEVEAGRFKHIRVRLVDSEPKAHVGLR